MRLVFVHGPAAAGKLTIARELAARSDLRLFHNHLTVDLLGAVFDFGSQPFVRLREMIWLEVFAAAAAAEMSLIFTFNPERTVAPDFAERCVRVVEEQGGDVVFVELVCPEAEIEARIENRSRAEFGKLRSLEQYRALREEGAFDYPSLPTPTVRIDTSAVPPQEAARQILAALEAAG